jgi:two-component system KDP operon response regulator KdpE
MYQPTTALDKKIQHKRAVALTRVLVIDDDIEMTDLLKIILAPCFDVITSNSGAEGIELARRENPDVIIVDLSMPGVDGLSVLHEVRKFSNLPILMLSAVSKPGMAATVLDEGADDYMLKPMKTGMLLARLQRLAHWSREGKDTLVLNSIYQH